MSSNRQGRRQNLVDKDKDDDGYDNIFDAGKVKVSERSLHRTGIRGRKIWLFLTVLIILLILCIINLVILAVIYGVIRIDKDGVESLSFFEDGMIRWTKPSDLETVTVYKNEIGGFKDRDLNIETTQNEIVLHGGPSTLSSQVHISDGNTTIIGKKGLKFVDPFVEKEIVSFDGSSSQFLQQSVHGNDIGINTVLSHRIVSNEYENLTLNSDKDIKIRGNEGIKMDGKSLSFNAEKDITITSTVGKGIIFDSPEIALHLKSNISPTINRYKLCICKDSFKVFGVKQASKTSSCNTEKKVCP